MLHNLIIWTREDFYIVGNDNVTFPVGYMKWSNSEHTFVSVLRGMT